MDNLPDFDFFEKLARIIADTSLPFFRHKLLVDNKDETGFDPVTIADRKTEIALREAIHEKYPDDGILGEEFPVLNGLNDRIWVIDPIDGTRSFISGMPIWGSLVGLVKSGSAIAGMLAQPYNNEIFYSCGKGSYLFTFLDGRHMKLSTSGCTLLDKATMFSTAPELFKGKAAKGFKELCNKVQLTRYSADCYAFAMLACGFVDLVVETGLKPYDITALIPIVEQAGGVIKQWDGNAAENAGNIIAAATPQLYEAALKVLMN
ncbi:inositol monophosphatase family protein [uncultured Bartonella sp.]|uniref:inositol monophosphatase family protein n=1 Tax=uncultured Bartonella sp. TaxID=104108 RepID=UPI00262C78A8|nr:inositol monophosphatase family protein [uncultured Bartonella sp.]